MKKLNKLVVCVYQSPTASASEIQEARLLFENMFECLCGLPFEIVRCELRPHLGNTVTWHEKDVTDTALFIGLFNYEPDVPVVIELRRGEDSTPIPAIMLCGVGYKEEQNYSKICIGVDSSMYSLHEFDVRLQFSYLVILRNAVEKYRFSI